MNTTNPDQLIAEKLTQLGDYAEKLRNSRWILAAVGEVFDIEGAPPCYTTVAIDGTVDVTAYVASVAAIAELRRELAHRGIRLRENGKVEEYESSNAQIHRLTAQGGGAVVVTFYFTAAAGVKRCEYVKVDEKTITQPVYELRCTEAAPELVAVGTGNAEPPF